MEENLTPRKRNAVIIENILATYTTEEINAYYFNHTRPECVAYFKLPNEKQLLKLLSLTGYDFSQVKPTLSNCYKPEHKRSHESYVAGGQKSAKTQKDNWDSKSEEEKENYRKMQQEAHSSEEFKEKIKKINLERFALMSEEERANYAKIRSEANKAKWSTEHDKILAKAYKTRQENNSFNSSSVEDTYYDFLCNKYGNDNVVRQYKDARYPFSCDFYIKSLDLFIELNLSWTHGFGPFIESEDCLAQLAIWQEKAKTSDCYKNAINTWTNLDVRKRQFASKNNLNYIVYYSEEELYD